MTTQPFDGADFQWGQAGLPGTGTTAGQIGGIESRLDALELLVPPTVLDQLTDVQISSPVSGQIIRHNGTQWVNYTPPGTTFTFGIPFVLDGAGAAITAGTKYTGIEIPFACTITGWTVVATASGNLVCTVSKAPYSTLTYAAISGTEKPTLAAVQKNQDLTLTTWTTAVAAGDLLQIAVDSLATVQFATVTLRLTRTI